jgi:uncharacterized protein YdhG (YjbR/CyaY superfamily)
MKSPRLIFVNHDDYFAETTPEALVRLRDIQTTVEALLPNASRCISYGMPAYKSGRVFFYFAAFKNHIGIYPPVIDDAALITALTPYRGPKGNLIFPYNQPLPLQLIGRTALALFKQYHTTT